MIITQPFQTVLSGEEFESAILTSSTGQNDQLVILTFKFMTAAATVEGFTRAILGKQMVVVVDGRVIVRATINGVISTGGELTSTSWSSAANSLQVNNLGPFIQSGVLPLQMDILDSQKL